MRIVKQLKVYLYNEFTGDYHWVVVYTCDLLSEVEKIANKHYPRYNTDISWNKWDVRKYLCSFEVFVDGVFKPQHVVIEASSYDEAEDILDIYSPLNIAANIDILRERTRDYHGIPEDMEVTEISWRDYVGRNLDK